MKKAIIFVSSIAIAAAAAVPLVVDVETSEARTRYLDVFRGETVDLELPFLSYGSPLAVTNGTPAGVWWQTNGMGNAWWQGPASVSTDGVARASWTPAMDCGADRYAFFVGVGGSDRSYRAAFTVRMHGAPGSRPNEITPPVQVLDFAKIVVTNEPWSVAADETDPVFMAWKESYGIAIGTGADVGRDVGYGVAIGAYAQAEMYGTAIGSEDDEGNFAYAYGNGTVQIGPGANVDEGTLKFRNWTLVGNDGVIPGARLPAGLAKSADVAEVLAEATAARTESSLVYKLLMGSNVVTEVTNYNSRDRAPQLRLLQLDADTREYFTVWAETNGLARTLAEAKVYADTVWQDLEDSKAARAWSRHTSGLGADAPAGTTWISTPETVIAGGYEYSQHITSHGEVWVLTSNGMGFGGDTNSYFRVSTPDGETLFSIEKTDEQIIGVQTDGISVSGGTVTLNVGVVTYNGQAPICMAAQSVTGPWADLSEGRPAWISSIATNGVNGAWSFELESTSSAAFFYFMVKQPGATVIKNSAQTDFSGGILVEGTRFYPHKSGSTLTWTTTP